VQDCNAATLVVVLKKEFSIPPPPPPLPNTTVQGAVRILGPFVCLRMFGERQPVPHTPGSTVMAQATAAKYKGQ